MIFPNKEQQAFLKRFAEENGRNWRSRLRKQWQKDEDGPVSRQIRNQWALELRKMDPHKLFRQQVAEMTKHYILAAIWTDAPEDQADTDWIVPQLTKFKAYQQCLAFAYKCGDLFWDAMACYENGYGLHPDAGSAEAAFGHDFWLTRNGHGTGFWDREREGLPKDLGDKLSGLCRGKPVDTRFQARRLYLEY